MDVCGSHMVKFFTISKASDLIQEVNLIFVLVGFHCYSQYPSYLDLLPPVLSLCSCQAEIQLDKFNPPRDKYYALCRSDWLKHIFEVVPSKVACRNFFRFLLRRSMFAKLSRPNFYRMNAFFSGSLNQTLILSSYQSLENTGQRLKCQYINIVCNELYDLSMSLAGTITCQLES